MKYPSHILLDLNKPTTDKLTKNWTLLYKSTFLNNTFNKSTKKLFNLGAINVNKSVNTLLIFNSKSKNKLSRNNSILWSLFDINFLKKEKLWFFYATCWVWQRGDFGTLRLYNAFRYR